MVCKTHFKQITYIEKQIQNSLNLGSINGNGYNLDWIRSNASKYLFETIYKVL